MIHTFIPKDSSQSIITEIKEPSLINQAINFSKAIINHTFTGFQKTTREEEHRRLNICKGCEFYNADKDQCLKCGCGGLKRTWEEQKCPIGKWELPVIP